MLKTISTNPSFSVFFRLITDKNYECSKRYLQSSITKIENIIDVLNTQMIPQLKLINSLVELHDSVEAERKVIFESWESEIYEKRLAFEDKIKKIDEKINECNNLEMETQKQQENDDESDIDMEQIDIKEEEKEECSKEENEIPLNMTEVSVMESLKQSAALNKRKTKKGKGKQQKAKYTFEDVLKTITKHSKTSSRSKSSTSSFLSLSSLTRSQRAEILRIRVIQTAYLLECISICQDSDEKKAEKTKELQKKFLEAQTDVNLGRTRRRR